MKLSEHLKALEQDPEYVQAVKELRLKLDLANVVLKARVEMGFSQTQLAKAIGTKQANISRIESALGNPTIEVIQKLANFLNIEVNFSQQPAEKQPTIQQSTENSYDSMRVINWPQPSFKYDYANSSKHFIHEEAR
mgnify:CR=1 FL=1